MGTSGKGRFWGFAASLAGISLLSGGLLSFSAGSHSWASETGILTAADEGSVYDETVDFAQFEHYLQFAYPQPTETPPEPATNWVSPKASVIKAPTGDNRDDVYALGTDPWRAPLGATLTPNGTEAVVTWTANKKAEGAANAAAYRILVRFGRWETITVSQPLKVPILFSEDRGDGLRNAGFDDLLRANWSAAQGAYGGTVARVYAARRVTASFRFALSTFRYRQDPPWPYTDETWEELFTKPLGHPYETVLADQDVRSYDFAGGPPADGVRLDFLPAPGSNRGDAVAAPGGIYFLFHYQKPPVATGECLSPSCPYNPADPSTNPPTE